MSENLNRRTFIRSSAAVTVVGALAGCGGSDGDGSTTEAETEAETTEGSDVPSEVEEYLSETSNFDGSVQDETGSDTVEVDVGAQGNGGNFAFAPPAIRVDTGTTVRWIWTGEGGQHNVVDDDGAFESEQVGEAGFEFEHTFETAGATLYYCTPHEGLGMKGAVIVE